MMQENQEKEESEIISMKKAIDYAKISRQSIYIAIKKGRLKADKTDGKWSISKKDIDHYRINKYNRDGRTLNGERVFDAEKGTFSVAQASKIVSETLGKPYPAQKIYYKIHKGTIRCSKFGSSWIVNRKQVEEIVENEINGSEDSKQIRFA